MSASGARVSWPAATALLSSTALAALHVAWSLGARWGYSACGWGELTVREARPGCGAATSGMSLADGWLAAIGWGAVAFVAAGVASGRRVGRVPALTAAIALLLVSFPLHLLFEIPVGLAGTPTDWRHVATRLVAVGTAVALVLAVRRPRCPHPQRDAPLSRPTRRAVWVAALVPCVCWAGPHLAWLTGSSLGISDEILHDGQDLSLATQAAITFAPVAGAALTLELLTPLARRVPDVVPALRRPPHPPDAADRGGRSRRDPDPRLRSDRRRDDVARPGAR